MFPRSRPLNTVPEEAVTSLTDLPENLERLSGRHEGQSCEDFRVKLGESHEPFPLEELELATDARRKRRYKPRSAGGCLFVDGNWLTATIGWKCDFVLLSWDLSHSSKLILHLIENFRRPVTVINTGATPLLPSWVLT